MGSTFKGEIGSAFNDDDPPASELKYVHERARELGFFDWADIAKAFGYRNGSAVLSALQLYEHTDYLVTPYRVRLSQVLQLEEGRFRQQEAAATGETDRDLRKLIENFRLIMANRKFVEARRDFYNIQFPGIGFSAAYVGRRTPLTFGQLLSHWHNGDFILEKPVLRPLICFFGGRLAPEWYEQLQGILPPLHVYHEGQPTLFWFPTASVLGHEAAV